MVERVLCHSVKHKVKVVPLAGDPLAQARIRQLPNRLYQHIVRMLRMSNSFAPLGLSRVGDDGKIRSTGELHFFPAQPAAGRIVPGRDVQHQFPDAMNIGQRLSRSRGGIHVL